MKKLFILTACIIASLVTLNTNTAKAQITISPGLEVAVPLGNWSSFANLGIGASAQVQYTINEKLAATGTLGYIHFLTDKAYGTDFSVGAIPLQAGLKYYFAPNCYGMGQLGFHIMRASVTVLGQKTSDSDTNLSLGVGAGYEVNLGNLKLDLAGRFQFVDDASYLGLRAGLVFPLGGDK